MTDVLSRAAALLVEGDKDRRPAWYGDPCAFADQCIDWPEGQSLAPYQRELMQALVEHRRVSARGPHGLGKSAVSALLLLWFALGRELAGEDWKIMTTAGAWRQLTNFLWPEVHLWARRLRWDKLGREPFDPRTELMQTLLRLRHGQAFGGASTDPALLEGMHAMNALVIFDESKSIPAGTWAALEGALSGQGTAYALAVSTPGTPSGVFYDIHSRKTGYEDWWTRHVPVEEAIAAGRISASWVEARRRQWGADSPLFVNRVLGEFASDDETGVIPLSWVSEAVERWEALRDAGEDTGPVTVVGADIARTGPDATVLALRHANFVEELRKYPKAGTMETVGRIAGILDANPDAQAVIDVIGVGGPVLDRLRERGYRRASGFNASAGTHHKDRSGEIGFLNLRAAAWWALRERLDPSFDPDLCLPPDDDLMGELVTTRYSITSAGKIQVESKDQIRARIGRSTDSADAVVMACYDASTSGQGRVFIELWQNELAENETAAARPEKPPWALPMFARPYLGDGPPQVVEPRACPQHRFFDNRCVNCGVSPEEVRSSNA